MKWPKTYTGNERSREVISQYVDGSIANGSPVLLLLTGPSGCGKNFTTEPIVAALGLPAVAMVEVVGSIINTARGFQRMIQDVLYCVAKYRGCVIFIDEADGMKDNMQHFILKPMEEGKVILSVGENPVSLPNVHWIMATTRPEKLRVDIHTRMKEVPLSLLSVAECALLAKKMANGALSGGMLLMCAKNAAGNPRLLRNLIRDAIHAGGKDASEDDALAQAQIDRWGVSVRGRVILKAVWSQDMGRTALDDIANVTGYSVALIRQEESKLRGLKMIRKEQTGRALTTEGIEYILAVGL